MKTSDDAFISVALLILMAGCPAEPEPEPESDTGSGQDVGSDDGGVEDVGGEDVGQDSGGGEDAGEDAGEDGGEDAGGGCEACDYVPASQHTDVQEVEGFTVTSPAGDRELPILVRFPADPTGPVPVVVWSHGGSWGESKQTTHEAWSRVFARAGYAVVHWSMVRPTVEQLGQICQFVGVEERGACNDLSVTGDADPDAESVDNPFQATSITRAVDVKAVLAALPRIKERFAQNDVELDIEAPALAGWSAGSQSTLQLAGATRLIADDLEPFSSPSDQPSAFVALSPQGPGHSKFFEGEGRSSWDEVRGPVIVLTGVGDEKLGNDLDGPTRLRAYELMPAGDKRLFYSTDEGSGIKHGTFNLDGLDSEDPRVASLSRALTSSVLAFVDCHTRSVQAGCDWLDTDAALELASGMARIESK